MVCQSQVRVGRSVSTGHLSGLYHLILDVSHDYLFGGGLKVSLICNYPGLGLEVSLTCSSAWSLESEGRAAIAAHVHSPSVPSLCAKGIRILVKNSDYL